MFCTNCGKAVKENAKFCPECGSLTKKGAGKVSSEKTESVTPARMPAQTQQVLPAEQPVAQVPSQPPPQPVRQPSQVIPETPPQAYQAAPAAPAPKKKSRKALFGIAGGAAAAVLVFMLVIFPAIGKGGGDVTDTGDAGGQDLTINVYIEPPGGRDVSFNVTEAGFSTNDPTIRMIEVNQGLSYGFDSDTGEFYIMDSFVSGKETGIFIDLEKPLDPKSEVRLTVEKDGEQVATLAAVEVIDDNTLLFQPKNMSEVGYWEPGAYTFTFEMDDSVATRTTNFFKSMPMRVLAVPIVGNYSGDIRRCEDDWKQGSTMITATYPLARDEVEYILGPEQDLSDPKYDLNTKEGRKEVWLALRALQTPNDDYTMIVGFMRTPTKQGYLGYTYGEPATIVCESEPDILATVVHEIAHCYKVGDEYEDGSLNNELNPPPYGMKGHDIITRDPAEGTKEKVIGGYDYGLKGSGSVIYPEQRAYWPEGRQLLGAASSIMGEGTGADSFTFWTSSDIWNHLFEAFTGQYTAKGFGTGTQAADTADPGTKGEYWGQCYKCFVDVYDPLIMIECGTCHRFVPVAGEEFGCGTCGANYVFADFSDDDLWLYHPDCDSVLYYPEFIHYNSGSIMDMSSFYRLQALEIMGDVGASGSFSESAWYSYKIFPSSLTTNLGGEYSVCVYDGSGEILSMAYFDAVDKSQVSTKEGVKIIEDAGIPIRVLVRFPDNASKVVINKGDSEIYSKDLLASTPEVEFTNLKEGQELSDQTTLTWKASDPGGGELTFQIWYIWNDEEYLVANNVTGTSYDADLTDYPGSDQSRFRILASNGARTGTGESPAVSVPYRAPDILTVIPEGTQYKVTDLIEISGKVYDAQDGWFLDVGFEWYVDGVNIDEEYDSFYFFRFPYMLEPGMHTITMTATNSGGVSSTKDYTIEIVNDESDLPDDWSRNDITLSLRLGYHFPLNRLDSPVTRMDFAKAMFYLYAMAYPGEEVDFDVDESEDLPEFSDMSNDVTDWEYLVAVIMLCLGIMDANDGAFDPYGTMTEREAMHTLYTTLYCSENMVNVTGMNMDESVFLPELSERGVFDEPGSQNVYQADERMTNRLAFVRIARILKIIYDLDDYDYGASLGFFTGNEEEFQ